MDLSMNALKGQIPSMIANLPFLTSEQIPYHINIESLTNPFLDIFAIINLEVKYLHRLGRNDITITLKN